MRWRRACADRNFHAVIGLALHAAPPVQNRAAADSGSRQIKSPGQRGSQTLRRLAGRGAISFRCVGCRATCGGRLRGTSSGPTQNVAQTPAIRPVVGDRVFSTLSGTKHRRTALLSRSAPHLPLSMWARRPTAPQVVSNASEVTCQVGEVTHGSGSRTPRACFASRVMSS
jgi:hypothetical protein